MSDVSISFAGDSKPLEAEYEKLMRANQRLQDQVSKLTAEQKKAANEAQQAAKEQARLAAEQAKLAAQAAKYHEETRTPIERHQARVAQLMKVYERTSMSTETFSRKISQLHQQLADESGETARRAEEAARAEKQRKEELARAASKLAAEQARLSDHQAHMASMAQKYHEETRTPIERHRARVQQLMKVYAETSMTADTYGRKLRQLHQQLADETRKSNTELSKSQQFGSQLLSTLGGMAVSYISVSTAIRAVNYELDHMHRKQDAALDSFRKMAAVVPNLMRNTMDRDFQQTAADRRALSILNRDLKIPEEQLTTAFGELRSTGADTQTALGTMALAGKVVPEGGQTLGEVASGMTFVQKATGAKTPKEALGFLLALGQEAASSSLGQTAEVAVPKIKSLMASDMTADEAAALVAAGSQFGDKDLRLSSTALDKVAQQMQQLLPEKDYIDPETKKRVKGTGMRTFAERLAHVQAMAPAERKAFSDSLHYETAARGVVLSLLEGGDQGVAGAFKQSRQRIAAADKGKLVDDLIDKVQNDPSVVHQQTENQRKNIADEFGRTGDTARWAQLRKTLERVQEKRPASPFGFISDWATRRAIDLGEMMGGDFETEAISALAPGMGSMLEDAGFAARFRRSPAEATRGMFAEGSFESYQIKQLEALLQMARTLDKIERRGANPRPARVERTNEHE